MVGCAVLLAAALLAAGVVRAVIAPDIDRPERVDAVVVVAGSNDDRYVYARHLAEEGRADYVLISRPPSELGKRYLELLDRECSSNPIRARDGREIPLECFRPDIDTTEGETTAATRIARERGWKSLLVVTYWGHVSRVRLYFEQCFDGDVYVTDTPRPTQISKKYAITHETGGYVKALLKPAC